MLLCSFSVFSFLLQYLYRYKTLTSSIFHISCVTTRVDRFMNSYEQYFGSGSAFDGCLDPDKAK
jgi:hypothetical protein